jgi:hypothetical protein
LYYTRTDKNTTHSYLPLHEKLLKKKQETAQNILETGIQDGGSIRLWRNYFINATIFGSDIIHIDQITDDFENDENIVLYTFTDAYNEHLF